jgi:hypothetical protein
MKYQAAKSAQGFILRFMPLQTLVASLFDIDDTPTGQRTGLAGISPLQILDNVIVGYFFGFSDRIIESGDPTPIFYGHITYKRIIGGESGRTIFAENLLYGWRPRRYRDTDDRADIA